MRSPNAATHDDIDVLSLWQAIKRNFTRLVMVAVGVGALTFGVLSTMAPRYSSEAQIAIGSKTSNPFPEGRDKPGTPDGLTQRMDPAAINTQVRALRSNDLLLKV